MSGGASRLTQGGGGGAEPGGPVRPVWPRLTSGLAEQLVAQARRSMSIYDRSGVVAEFEDAFARYVGTPRALSTCSGTTALHSIYYGAGIEPGDEVIVCDYGFFATVAPLVHLGARPVFVDCAADGTISVEHAAAAITPRTRAIVVTHMWGQPGQLDALRALCDQHGLLLLEDCSHAHGARFHGAVVGSFGDAAAWSLQAQKTVWAGEGGVLATRDDGIYERALLLGHFNLRALQEIPETSPNFAFAFTGTGLKYRAHPLALAVALPQLATLDQLIESRQQSAKVLMDALTGIPGVELLSPPTAGVVHGYYALVALIDPAACGFDRDLFVKTLAAAGIELGGAPRQMGSMSHYNLFAGNGEHGGRSSGPLDNSQRITATAVKFFVPAEAADLTGNTDVSVVARVIAEVGAGLSRRG